MCCRLCLCYVPASSSISIHDNPKPLAERISTCCGLQVERDDGLPDIICISCEANLNRFTNFKNICIKNDKMVKHNLDHCLDFKCEEVILDDLIWQNELAYGHSSTSTFNSSVNNKDNDGELHALEEETTGTNTLMYDNTEELFESINISHEDLTGSLVEMYSNKFELDQHTSDHQHQQQCDSNEYKSVFDVEKLIFEMKKHPALYDKRLKQYSDRNIREKLWAEVCSNVILNWNTLSATEKKTEVNHAISATGILSMTSIAVIRRERAKELFSNFEMNVD
ncbi:uncharacterized protein LOC143921150 isoform X2 [Arctopsyche grandis]|uniref:uncharacterized protein LOC143921150 isoform X2 n=1 Tax=Arctopsyche grandis TaxID=121162 RepID=UPI00406D6A98